MLTNQRIHGILNHINSRSHFFSRVIVRFFSSSSKQYDGAEGDQNEVDYFLREEQHIIKQYHFDNEADDNNTHLVDAIARRKKRIELESENIRKSIIENNHQRMVDRVEKDFDNHLKELLQLLSE